MPSLSEIPFLDRYRQREAQLRGEGLDELKQVTGVMTLQGLLQKQQEAQAQKQAMAQSGGDPAKAIPLLVQSGNYEAASKLGDLVKATQPKPAEPFTLSPGARRYGPDGREIAAAPEREQPFNLPPGGTRYNPDGTPMVTAPAAPPTPSPISRWMDEYDALPDGNPRKAVLKRAIDAVGRPPAGPSSFPIVQTAEGIFERRPTGLVRLNVPGTDKPLTSMSLAGGGMLNPQALQFMAKQYLAGDRQAVAGFARSAPARIAIQNAIVDEAQARNMTPEQTAAQIADFAGTMSASRAVGARAANISLAATEAEEMLGIVKQTSDNFARTNFIPWNMALRAYESGTGTPEIAEFGAAVNALVNVYARAINPTGVPTVSDKEHARAVLNTIQSPAQVDAVLGIIKRELAIAKKAPAQVSSGLRNRVTGQPADGWSIRPK